MGKMNDQWFNLKIETQNQCHVDIAQNILDLGKNSFEKIILNSFSWNLVSKTWKRPWCIQIDSKRSTLKIWVFRVVGSGFRLSPLELKMDLEKNSHGFWKFGKLNWNPFEEINKTYKSFQKQRRLIFSAKFSGKLKFCENRG